MSATIAMLAGLGKGYLDGSKERRDEERQAKKDAMEKELHDAKMSEHKLMVDDRSAARDVVSAVPTEAYTPEQIAENDAIANAKDADGNPYYSVGTGPDGKSFVSPNFTNADGGEYAPVNIAKKGTSLFGQTYDKPLAQSDIQAARQAKLIDLALGGNNSASTALKNSLDIQRASVGLKDDQLKVGEAEERVANEKFNKGILGVIEEAGGDEFTGIANFLTKTRINGLDGASVKSVVSADGKTVDLVASKEGMPDKVVKSYDNTPSGRRQALDQAFRTDTKTKRAWIVETEKDAADAAKADLDERKFNLDKDKAKTDAEYKSGTLAYYNKSLGVKEAGVSAKTDSRLPEHVSKQLQEFSKRISAIDEEVMKAELSGNAIDPGIQEKYAKQRRALLGQRDDLLRPYTQQDGVDPLKLFSTDKATGNPINPQTGVPYTNAEISAAVTTAKNGLQTAAKPDVPTVQEKAVIGAKRVTEARSKASAPTAASIAAGKGEFNEAGYSSVQGTIDGAKRGDKVALQLLQKMIDRGETNPRQRQEIAEIQKAK